MNYDTTLVTPPSGEPIHLDHAKLHCGVTDTDRDTLFPTWIAQAREGAESETNRQLIHARYALTLPTFPPPFGYSALAYPRADLYIVIPRAPLVRVLSITYVDTSGATQTLAAAAYVVNAAKVPARITPAYGYIWPATLYDTPAAVTVTYDVGYASPITADAAADTITVSGPVTYAVADPMRFSNSGGALPGGLSAGTTYFVKTAPGAGVYTLSATSGGSLLDITSAGSGINLVGEIPPSLITWMLLQVEQVKENRGQSAIGERGETLIEMPFADTLIERLRVYLP